MVKKSAACTRAIKIFFGEVGRKRRGLSMLLPSFAAVMLNLAPMRARKRGGKEGESGWAELALQSPSPPFFLLSVSPPLDN